MPTLWYMYARALGLCMPSVMGGIRPYALYHAATNLDHLNTAHRDKSTTIVCVFSNRDLVGC